MSRRIIWAILECIFYLSAVYLILEFIIFRTETPQERSSLTISQVKFNSINVEAEL